MFTDPRTRSSLLLDVMLREAHTRSYPDLQFVAELATRGMDDRTFMRPDIMLCFNYKGFFERRNFQFAALKLRQKLSDFTPIRLLDHGCGSLPFSNTVVNPRNVAIRPGSDPPKRRVTADYAASRSRDEFGKPGFTPRRAKDPGPLSVNAGVDLEDTIAFPPIRLLRLRELARQAAILQSISEYCAEETPPEFLLAQSQDDMEAYYEQCPMDCRCDPHNVEIVSGRTAYVDPRGCFGMTSLPHLFNRLSFFLAWIISARMRDVRREQDRSLSAPLRAILRKWTLTRRAAAGSGDVFIIGIYFDDFSDYCYQFAMPWLQRTKQSVFQDFGVRMSEDKKRVCPAGQHMVILGLLSDAVASRIRHDAEKATKYVAVARQVINKAQANSSRLVPNELVDRMEGQFMFCSQADPCLIGDLQVVRATLGTTTARQHGSTKVSLACAERIKAMIRRLSVATFVAFAPRTGKMGDSHRPLLTILFDASGDTKRPPAGMSVEQQITSLNWFRGWGALFHLEGTDTVYYTQGFTTAHARSCLNDSTAAELFAANESLLVACSLRARLDIDILQVGDNTAARDIANTSKAHQAAERALFYQRCALRDLMPPTTVAVHQNNRSLNTESDILSRVNVLGPFSATTRLQAAEALATISECLRTRFGRTMRMRSLSPPDIRSARARMSIAVKAKRTYERTGYAQLGSSPFVDNPYPELQAARSR